MKKTFSFIEDATAPVHDKEYIDILYHSTGLIFLGRPNKETKEVEVNNKKFFRNDNDTKFLFQVDDNKVSIFDKEGRRKLYNITVIWK